MPKKDVKASQAAATSQDTAPKAQYPKPVDLRTKRDRTQFKSLLKLGFFSALMFCAPFAVFIASEYTYLDPLYKVTIGIPSPDKRTTVGGIAAVIVANIVVALFVLTAFNDGSDSQDGKEE
ncbi:hypothetical protein DUNSADRAFT_1900 [Dunaliella salina]|uniref:Vacuolar ATPase assembly integral membrane protein VMA21 homolog n=1 Tax=Dunaliella salina TaxID=3046 RepID=A0ABQ7GWJ5_DUNSA|nr:hypothetical protein DUNSADRAFT_1900 [Dunaliella salina]|eukprot:KAF5838955.1 hypothetical protein DUNSADRAFT_1900 [Dunaliella salina]